MEETDAVIWVRRSESGAVLSVSQHQDELHTESCPPSHADVVSFLYGVMPDPQRTKFRESDLDLIRALEDLVDVLIRKDVLRLTDLPESVQQKLHSRRRMRGSIRSLNLLDADDS